MRTTTDYYTATDTSDMRMAIFSSEEQGDMVMDIDSDQFAAGDHIELMVVMVIDDNDDCVDCCEYIEHDGDIYRASPSKGYGSVELKKVN